MVSSRWRQNPSAPLTFFTETPKDKGGGHTAPSGYDISLNTRLAGCCGHLSDGKERDRREVAREGPRQP